MACCKIVPKMNLPDCAYADPLLGVEEVYCHNPYSIECPKITLYKFAARCSQPPQTRASKALRCSRSCVQMNQNVAHHTSLWGTVRFIPYPRAFPPPTVFGESRNDKTNLFFGQVMDTLPLEVIPWLCSTIAGVALYNVRRPVYRSGHCHGCCINPSDADFLIYQLHKKVLFDFTGVWYAATEQEQLFLSTYCATLNSKYCSYFDGIPRRTIVVEHANRRMN